MTENNQIAPLAPAKFFPRSDEEFAAKKPTASTQIKSSKCFVYVLAGIVFLSVVALVFALAVMRARTPDIELYSVTVKNFKYGNASFPSFNITLAAEVTIKNKNFGKFEFENSTANVLYDGMVAGEAKLREGSVSARDIERMNIMVDVGSYGFSDTKNLSGDINSGMLKLSSYAELRGKVFLMGIVKKRTAVMNCTMVVHLKIRVIEDLLCT